VPALFSPWANDPTKNFQNQELSMVSPEFRVKSRFIISITVSSGYYGLWFLIPKCTPRGKEYSSYPALPGIMYDVPQIPACMMSPEFLQE
jgi:hypothetical protein